MSTAIKNKNDLKNKKYMLVFEPLSRIYTNRGTSWFYLTI